MNIIEGKIIYISGPMTGLKNLNAANFEFAVDIVKQMNAKAVLTPHCLPEGLEYDDYMHIDYAMVDVADIIVVLPGWSQSPGSLKELDRAMLKGKKIVHLHHLLDQLNQQT